GDSLRVLTVTRRRVNRSSVGLWSRIRANRDHNPTLERFTERTGGALAGGRERSVLAAGLLRRGVVPQRARLPGTGSTSVPASSRTHHTRCVRSSRHVLYR